MFFDYETQPEFLTILFVGSDLNEKNPISISLLLQKTPSDK